MSPPEPFFEPTEPDSAGTISLALHGEIDVATAPDLDRELHRIESMRPEQITLDLSDLEFLDSSGLRVLFAAQRRAESNGHRFVLTHVGPQAQRLLSLTGPDAQFAIE